MFSGLNPILFVSSNVAKRDIIASRMRHSGLSSELSASGFHTISLLEAALEEKKMYSLLLLLDNSDDMPAQEVISLSRNVVDSSSMPILYMTTDTDGEHIQEVQELGADKVIPYTDNFQAILNAIEKLTITKNKTK